jgi:hypothetical protein
MPVPETDQELLARLERLEKSRRVLDHHGLPPLGETPLPIVAPPLPMAGWQVEKRRADERKRQDTLDAAAAREEAIRQQAEAAEAERRRVWEANAPRRAKALKQLPGLEAELAVISEEYDQIVVRVQQLRKEASQ